MAEEPKPTTSKLVTSLTAAIATLISGGGMWYTVSDAMNKASEKREVAIEVRVKKDTLVETRIARLEERVASLQVAYDNLRADIRAPKPATP
jgi:hypothetical protein